jgi:hypothetical protein
MNEWVEQADDDDCTLYDSCIVSYHMIKRNQITTKHECAFIVDDATLIVPFARPAIHRALMSLM